MTIKMVNYSYDAPTAHILATPDHYVAIGVILHKDSPLATAVGSKKIVKAGTLYPSNDGNAKGVILNDYDVTDGDQNAALVIHGFIQTSQLPAAPSANAVAALPNITFLGKSTIIKSATAAPAVGATTFAMTVNIYGTKFLSACTTTSNWTIAAGTTVLALASVTKVDDNTVTLNFTSAAVVAGTLTVTAKAAAVENATQSNTISVVVA